MERGGEIAQRVVVGLLVAQEVALQLEVGAGAAEHADEPIDQPADAEPRAAQHGAPAERDRAPTVWPSISSSVSAPSPFGARSLAIVSRRQRFW